jgi:hypothetical protein
MVTLLSWRVIGMDHHLIEIVSKSPFGVQDAQAARTGMPHLPQHALRGCLTHGVQYMSDDPGTRSQVEAACAIMVMNLVARIAIDEDTSGPGDDFIPSRINSLKAFNT